MGYMYVVFFSLYLYIHIYIVYKMLINYLQMYMIINGKSLFGVGCILACQFFQNSAIVELYLIHDEKHMMSVI